MPLTSCICCGHDTRRKDACCRQCTQVTTTTRQQACERNDQLLQAKLKQRLGDMGGRWESELFSVDRDSDIENQAIAALLTDVDG